MANPPESGVAFMTQFRLAKRPGGGFLLPRIRNEPALHKPVLPTGPGAATVDRVPQPRDPDVRHRKVAN